MAKRKSKKRHWTWRLTKGTVKVTAKGGWWLTKKSGRGLKRLTIYLADEERLARTWTRLRARAIARLDRKVWPVVSADGEWTCLGCGRTGSFDLAKNHVCRLTPREPLPDYAKSDPKSKAAPPPKPKPSSTKGASIVPGNTAAARFSYLASALPETAGEWEQLTHDLFSGFLMLAQEIAGIAEDADIDARVVDALMRLSDDVADLAEPARDVRRVFRDVYALWIEAATSGVKVPRNPRFFEDAS